jgi:FdrA protein
MKRVLIERNRYIDSVFLMRISHELEQLPGVSQAIVAMGTGANLDNLRNAGFAVDESAPPILPHDVVIAMDGASGRAIDEARQRLTQLLAGRTEEDRGSDAAARPTTVPEAIEIDPDINLALISVPGTYAAREARQALRQRLHVMLFSDNVSVEDEISLKDEAIERGLLMMGADCGTAILNGVPLGFANVVRRGSIGIVGASGTGIQEISSLVHRLGGGVSQAIGTGGRDLSGAVGARMSLFAIEALADDPATAAIVVVSKAPERGVAERVIGALRSTGKPGVVHFVAWGLASESRSGGAEAREALGGDLAFARTLAEAAELACAAVGIPMGDDTQPGVSVTARSPHELAGSAERVRRTPTEVATLAGTARGLRRRSPQTRGRVRGLFCGGTLAQEAWSVLYRAGLDVRSNVAADPTFKIDPGATETGHVIWDLGDDAFTVGKPHPMIEPSLRDDGVLRCANDPTVGVVLVDCVLGYGAHPDPAGSLADAAGRAIEGARKDGRDLSVVASVTGTDGDPQNLSRQLDVLIEAGVLVAPSNAAAARWVAEATKGGTG